FREVEMFESQQSNTGNRSLPILIAASILFPPLGLALIWGRSDWANRTKVISTVAVALLAAGYAYLFWAWRISGNKESHYAALEQHRAQQHSAEIPQPATANQAAAPTTPAQQSASPTQTASAGQANPNAASGAESASAHATRNYWTNFRGPNRDGRYDEV